MDITSLQVDYGCFAADCTYEIELEIRKAGEHGPMKNLRNENSKTRA